MAEFGVGNTLLPQLPPSFDELRQRVEALRQRNRDLEAQSDQNFIDATKFATGVDLTELIERGRAAKDEGRIQSIWDVLIIDTTPRAASSSSSDMSSSGGASGGILSVNQNGQVTGVVGGTKTPTDVVMLPMWAADP